MGLELIPNPLQSDAMNSNEARDTPGRLLLLWTALFAMVVLFSWRVHLGRRQFDWVEYPTALGDQKLYTQMLGTNDFFEPSVKFPKEEKGVFRRMFSPIKRQDEKMAKVALDSTGSHFVYAAESEKKKPMRYFLKQGENAYIEFGARKYYPANPEIAPAP